MSLAPGTRLGPYEIVAPLGAGGMGEVWRARDTKLDREVALKFLPASFAKDPERLARWGRRELVRELVSADPAGIVYGWLVMSPDGRFYLQRFRRMLTTVVFVTLS